jgi:hypothetical protein
VNWPEPGRSFTLSGCCPLRGCSSTPDRAPVSLGEGMSAHTATESTSSPLPEDDAEALFQAPALLSVLWADPKNMAEHLALWSLKYFGPRANTAVERLKASYPAAAQEQLEGLAVQHQTRVCMTEGAFVGGPFIFLLPIAFCAALLAQAQMAFELAAINGYSATDRMRAADLLVLQGAYSTTEEAGAALDTVTRAERKGGRLPPGTRWAMIKRMAFLLGLLTAPGTPKPSLLVSIVRWIALGATFIVGLVLPLVWVPYMAISMRRAALQMGQRGTAFYAAKQTEETGVTVTRAPLTINVGIAAGLVRMLLLIAVPIVIALIALLTDVNIGGGRWITALIALLVISALATLGWLGFRWLRRSRHHPLATA